MEWSERNRERLEIALTEADVAGVRVVDGGSIAFLLHVTALPEVGPMDIDARRQLVLQDVAQVRFLLRRVTLEGKGPAIPIGSIAEVDNFFDTLATSGSMYGWRYFDTELTADWPAEPSLEVSISHRHAQRTFYWFNECGRVEDGEIQSFCLEGTVSFNDLTVLRADETPQSVADFAEQGVRWWQAFQDFEERANVDAQQAWEASKLTWRKWQGIPSP